MKVCSVVNPRVLVQKLHKVCQQLVESNRWIDDFSRARPTRRRHQQQEQRGRRRPQFQISIGTSENAEQSRDLPRKWPPSPPNPLNFTPFFYGRIEWRMSTNGFGIEHVRSASHAGSWYNASQRDLDRQLTKWLDAAGERIGPARALISPHAGYSYCGETAAYAFKQIVPETVDRIFILGPSHVVALNGCAITTCTKYRTPLGDLTVDHKINEELRATHHFDLMDRRDEEQEHSIEMQLPFIAKVMGSRRYTIVPVLVGSLPGSRQQMYGNIFAHYMENPKNLFVISSDFCHWGDRFSFSPYDRSSGLPIYEQITNMDRQGMNAIETLNPAVFNEYLKKTQNTICGRNPILIMLQAAEHFRLVNNHTHEFQFLHYTQSNKVRSPVDSSVSYASGVLFVHPN